MKCLVLLTINFLFIGKIKAQTKENNCNIFSAILSNERVIQNYCISPNDTITIIDSINYFRCSCSGNYNSIYLNLSRKNLTKPIAYLVNVIKKSNEYVFVLLSQDKNGGLNIYIKKEKNNYKVVKVKGFDL